MKTLRLNPAAAGVLLLALITAGCEHKKPVLVMPQQPPPTSTPQATPTPTEAEAQPAQQQPEAQPAPTPAEQPQAAGKTAEKPKPKHPRHAAAKKPGEKPEVAHNTPRKIIPAEPAPTPQQTGQISPGPTPADGGNSQASTDQLLQGAEANLNGITRTLSKDEEAMRAQIREFIKQSRTATTENDPTRAHTLAVKARLLSDELVKQR
jgi:outer membrane biosynthesis protein TonB